MWWPDRPGALRRRLDERHLQRLRLPAASATHRRHTRQNAAWCLRSALLLAAALILAAGLAPACAQAGPVAAISLPAGDFIPGWRCSGAPRIYAAQNLYGYIDGGAELFLEYGFAELTVQRYSHGEEEFVLDLYRMASADAALGIYLARKGEEQPIAGIPCRATGNGWQLAALKGRHYIQVTNLSGGELLPVMVTLVQELLQHIPEEAAAAWFAQLPSGCIPGSELLVAGPYSLQPLFTFGEGDVLQLAGRAMGVYADRRTPDLSVQGYLRIDYPDTAAARSALANVQAQLDPWLTPLPAGQDSLLFRDFQEKFGRITRSGARLEIAIHLSDPRQ